MNLQKKCLDCQFTLANPDDTPESVLQGGRTKLCVESPPAVTAILLPNGQLARITGYPVVTRETASCSRFVPTADGFASETLLKS